MQIASSLAIALRLHERGFSVIPVPRPRPGARCGEAGDGKVPAIKWKEFQTRVPTMNELHGWFSAEPMNLAVITGAVSGIVVVDADSNDALRWCTRNLPYTPLQTQTARGFHLWYRHPGIPVRNSARIETHEGRLKIDVRGDGGFVIAAGSLHASGVSYCEAGDWAVPRSGVPYFKPFWVERSARPAIPQTAGSCPTWDVADRARRYLAGTPRPEIGHGSDVAMLSAACRLVRGFDLSSADAVLLLWEWAGGRPGWTHEWVAQKVAHAQRYGTEPVGALR